ncbi:MAG: plastocyanin/azurin family copper-binding protein [Candidatus Saccharimonadales bacterium]
MNNKTLVRSAVVVVIVMIFAAVALASMNKNDTMMGSEGSTMTGSKMNSMDSKTSDKMVASNQITYKGFDVVQKNITVKKGTTVTWTNDDSAKHDVTPDEETEEFKTSELFGKGETYSVTFNTVGKFSYYCSPHPYMKGTVTVTE